MNYKELKKSIIEEFEKRFKEAIVENCWTQLNAEIKDFIEDSLDKATNRAFEVVEVERIEDERKGLTEEEVKLYREINGSTQGLVDTKNGYNLAIDRISDKKNNYLGL